MIKVYRTTILPVLLYRFKILSPILRKESRLRVFENRLLSIIFGPKREDVTEELRKLHNNEFNDL